MDIISPLKVIGVTVPQDTFPMRIIAYNSNTTLQKSISLLLYGCRHSICDEIQSCPIEFSRAIPETHNISDSILKANFLNIFQNGKLVYTTRKSKDQTSNFDSDLNITFIQHDSFKIHLPLFKIHVKEQSKMNHLIHLHEKQTKKRKK